MVIVFASVLLEGNNYYSQFFLNECLCKSEVLYFDRTDVSHGFMQLRQVDQKILLFITIGIFQVNCLTFDRMPAMDVMIYSRCLRTLKLLPF